MLCFAWLELANHSKLKDLEDAGQGIRRPVRVCTNAAGSRDLGLKKERKKKNRPQQPKTQKQPDVFQRQAATGLIQLWSIMWFLCSAVSGGVIVWAARTEENNTFKKKTHDHTNIDGHRSNK